MGDVTPFNRGGGDGPRDPHELWLRRQALQIAAQLPDNIDDAMRIVRLVELLLRTFVNPQSPT